MLKRAALYWHTARHLRPGQITARVWHRLWRPSPDTRPAPATRARVSAFLRPVARDPSMTGPRRFALLGGEYELPQMDGWDDSTLPLLWCYNLHYFDDLNARDADARREWHAALIDRWVRENPPGQGIGWESFPVSLRLVNWIKWCLCGHALSDAARHSLAVQARWLERRLETHLLANHLLANAKALLYAGAYFSGAESERWSATAEKLLHRELDEQVLADGGHFELSTMYHAIVLEDLLDIVNLLSAFGRPVPPRWLEHLARMRQWLATMTHPDGGIAFFNDAALGIAPTPAALEAYAARLALPAAPSAEVPLALLRASGYARLAQGEAWLACDAGAVGPDYQPGHAHADTLSFELSLRGRRVLVNSGTSEYGTGPERQRQRGTAAHNTVVVDGLNSSEVWGGFRVARRARAELEVESATPPLVLAASHDGYCRVAGRHRRRWRLEPNSLRIEDEVEGSFASAEARFHVHPDFRVDADGSALTLRAAEGVAARLEFEGAATVSVQESTWHPRFGERLPNRCIAVRFAGASLVTLVFWSAAA